MLNFYNNGFVIFTYSNFDYSNFKNLFIEYSNNKFRLKKDSLYSHSI